MLRFSLPLILLGCAEVVGAGRDDASVDVSSEHVDSSGHEGVLLDLPDPLDGARLDGPRLDAAMDDSARDASRSGSDAPDWRDLPTWEVRIGESCNMLPFSNLVATGPVLDAPLMRPLRRGPVPDGEYVLSRVELRVPRRPDETLPDYISARIRVTGARWQFAMLFVRESPGHNASFRSTCELQTPSLIDMRVCPYTCPGEWTKETSVRYVFGAFPDYELRGQQLVMVYDASYVFTFDRESAP